MGDYNTTERCGVVRLWGGEMRFIWDIRRSHLNVDNLFKLFDDGNGFKLDNLDGFFLVGLMVKSIYFSRGIEKLADARIRGGQQSTWVDCW